MFQRLSQSFSNAFRKLSGKGTITESNVREAVGDVRESLLEADVSLEVVNAFCDSVLTEATGQKVLASLQPGEQFIGVVHQKLVEFLGGGAGSESATAGVLHISPGPTVVMMCGLQGSGKTTTCGKLAGYLKKRGRSVMLVAADLQRPAAVDQLGVLAAQVEREMPGGATVSFYSEPEKIAEYGKAVGVAVGVCRRAVEAARKQGVDTVILDTAGRLHINQELMGELSQINHALRPHQVFLVADAMTGQDAVRSARAFHQQLQIDGVILTKFDSDTRGGVALSVKHVTGAPIRFMGVGEKLDAIEEFHAQRIAGRMLGMGDVVSLVERAQEQVSQEEAEKLQSKMARGEMTMEDFVGQLRTLRRMGPMKQILGLLPGMSAALGDVHIEDKQLDRVEAIISSMTKGERAKPDIINNSRRRRIANGSGVSQDEVSQLVKQFSAINKLTKQMASMSTSAKVRAVKELGPQGMSGLLPGAGGLPGFHSKGSTASTASRHRFKKRK